MINIRKLESDLWESADLLRAGSKLTSNQYCMPVLGLLFLRYAYSLDHWRDKPTTQAVVSNLIRDSLFVSLPQSYDDQSINRYTCLIYEHVYNRYPVVGQ